MNKAEQLKQAIRTIPDFPVKGVLFRDVTTLLKNEKAFRLSCECMAEGAKELGAFEYITGIEARGFIYGAVLARESSAGFVPVRKPGKLPAAILSVNYDLEYGKDTVEVHVDAIVRGSRYLVVDDLLATGGTAEAVCRLIEAGGGTVVGCLFLVELPELGGRKKLENRKVVSILEFEGK
ncbi:adenine phosphoribosyltransferase [Bacteroidota bacterium]